MNKEHEKTSSEPKKIVLKSEINRAKNILEDIFYLRIEKIMNYAYSASKGGKPELRSMQEREKILYEDILKILEEYKIETLTPRIQTHEKQVKNENYNVVMILEDITFVGENQKRYIVKKDDIISLSKQVSTILCNTGKCKKISYDFDRF